MNESHEPDPRFVDALEGALRAAVRRRETFDPKPGNSMTRRLRTLRNLFVVAVSMLVGGAGTYAVTREDDAPMRALLTARCRALVEISQMRLGYYAEELKGTEKLLAAGAVTEDHLEHMRLQILHLKTDLAVRALRLEETETTGREPNDGISAPPVGGRDFVSERLDVQRRPREQQIALQVRRLDRLRAMAQRGLVSDTEIQVAEGEIAAMKAEAAAIDQRIALRGAFLSGVWTFAQVELMDMKSSAVGQREAAVRQVERLRQEYERSQRLNEREIVSRTELRAVEIDLRSAELQVELVNLEMRILEARLATAND